VPTPGAGPDTEEVDRNPGEDPEVVGGAKAQPYLSQMHLPEGEVEEKEADE
jgi:hypothetical protein